MTPESAAHFARTALRLGMSIADDVARPRWNPGDLFGDDFAPAGAR